MKKVLTPILTIVILINILASMNVHAAGSLVVKLIPASTTIRAGETITVTGRLESSVPVATIDLKITYDANVLEYIKAEAIGLSSGSTLDIVKRTDGIQFIYLDGAGADATIKSANLFKITFKVNSNVTVGAKTIVDAVIDVAGDGPGGAITTTREPVTMTIATPLLTNNYLSALTINTGVLSPAFDKNQTTYSVSVPFDVSALVVTAAVEDAKAKAVVSGAGSLKAGATTNVLVTVTAENGAKKIYTIKVARSADPNAPSSQESSYTVSSASISDVSSISSSSDGITSQISTESSQAAATDNKDSSGIPVWTVILITILSIAAGFISGFFIKGYLVR